MHSAFKILNWNSGVGNKNEAKQHQQQPKIAAVSCQHPVYKQQTQIFDVK